MVSISAVRADRVPLGILYMLGATVLFAVSTALAKWQVTTYSFAEVLFFRAAASLVTCAVLILPRTGLSVFRTARLRDHVGRGVTQGMAQSFILIAISLMPLAGAVAINFSSPLFAALFAALWLKEKIGLARGCALIIGFLGVLLVAAPGADTFRLGALFALGNAVLLGSVTAAVRGMSTTESVETLTFYQMIFLTGFFALALPVFGYITPTGADLIGLLLNGVINAVGQYWWTRSLSLAPPSAVGPFYYFSLVWALVLGFLLGRSADARPARRVRDRGRVGTVPALARDRQETARRRLVTKIEGGCSDESTVPPRRHRPRRSGPRQGADRRASAKRVFTPARRVLQRDLVERRLSGQQ
jgi:drug/metabolite transporter (DMT)-like permease